MSENGEGDVTEPAYEVGYGRPPRSGQFQKGVSGNPRGRRKGSKSIRAVVQQHMNALVAVRLDGKVTKMPFTDALVAKTFREGVTGSRRATDQSLKLIERFGDQELPTNEMSFDTSNLTLEEVKTLDRLLEKAGVALNEGGC